MRHRLYQADADVFSINLAVVLARVSGLPHDFNEEIRELNEDHLEEAQEELNTVNAPTQHLQHSLNQLKVNSSLVECMNLNYY